jgi:polysaccharide export outer membrane protein
MGIGVRILLATALIFGISGAAAAQELQSGDVLEISVYQDPKLNRQVVVGPTGMISFPLAGHLQAGGITPQALERTLRAKLRSKYAGDLDITVAVVSRDETQKPRIYVTGEVQRPGPHTISARTTVLQAISLAGGLSPFAAKQRIQIVRKVGDAEQIHVFNYRAFESGQDLSGNIDLRSGDVIIVPERGLFE